MAFFYLEARVCKEQREHTDLAIAVLSQDTTDTTLASPTFISLLVIIIIPTIAKAIGASRKDCIETSLNLKSSSLETKPEKSVCRTPKIPTNPKRIVSPVVRHIGTVIKSPFDIEFIISKFFNIVNGNYFL